MMIQEIEKDWRIKMLGSGQKEEWIPATVPGTVLTDLLHAGKIPDPYFKDNEITVREYTYKDYIYSVETEVTEKLLQCDEIILRFDGIDTIADISVNGCVIGRTNNMHRCWEFSVKENLRCGKNHIEVVIYSAANYMKEAFAESGTIGNEDTLPGFMHLRKAHYMSGWDWGACLPDMGIFRSVKLIGVCKARFDRVYIRQHHKEGRIILQPEIDIISPESSDPCGEYQLSLKIFSPSGDLTEERYISSGDEIPIKKPQLWWPNGFGKQALYKIRIELLIEGKTLDIWEKRIGLREITVVTDKDEWGNQFVHQINGVKIFAMGANYIPEDHLLGRVNIERTRNLLIDCQRANFNLIRVWGGGYYPDEWFYDLCDELGLLVWQDFMFACAVYDLTDEFEENIVHEFEDNIKRICHHPCLALWCGNNEMEMFVNVRHWVTKPSQVRDYLIMYEYLIPKILKKYDPQSFYWPASPSSGGSFDEPNDPDRGDVHNWEVWHGNKPFSEYRKKYFRYLSEFGFQALPSIKTLSSATDDQNDLNPYSYVVEKHQRNYGGNSKIAQHMGNIYRYPYSFEDFIYASQLLQAEAIRYGVEHYRRNRGRCMGTVYWQLNDCWPVVSWSSIDYYGRWKALHYFAKRFFAPVLVSCEEKSWLTDECNMNRPGFSVNPVVKMNISNETNENKLIKVRICLRDAKAEILDQWTELYDVEPFSAVWGREIQMPYMDYFNQYVSYEAYEDNEFLVDGTVIFSYPKYFRFLNPGLSYSISGSQIIVRAETFAKNVRISNKNDDLILSDNYFDMNAGEKKIEILKGTAEDIVLKSVFDLGR